MNHNYPEYIMRTIRETHDLDEDDVSRDREFQRLFPREVFEKMLEWEGIVGYGHQILSWIEDIFKVKLTADGEEQSREDFIQGLLNILIAQNLDDIIASQMADVICDTTKSVQNQ